MTEHFSDSLGGDQEFKWEKWIMKVEQFSGGNKSIKLCRKAYFPNHSSLAIVNLKSKNLSSLTGRWFGGFDSLENALMKNELVQKEAATPK